MNKLIFHWINSTGGLQGESFDWWMLFLTEPTNAIVPFLVLASYWAWQGGSKGRRVLLGIVILLIVVDGSGGLIKSWLQALRPCQSMSDVRLLVDCGLNSFPSNHAANMAALAAYLAFFYPRTLLFFGPLAFGVGLSRVYVGVHYPGDVVSGWIFGIFLASIIFVIHKKFFPEDLDSSKSSTKKSV